MRAIGHGLASFFTAEGAWPCRHPRLRSGPDHGTGTQVARQRRSSGGWCPCSRSCARRPRRSRYSGSGYPFVAIRPRLACLAKCRSIADGDQLCLVAGVYLGEGGCALGRGTGRGDREGRGAVGGRFAGTVAVLRVYAERAATAVGFSAGIGSRSPRRELTPVCGAARIAEP